MVCGALKNVCVAAGLAVVCGGACHPAHGGATRSDYRAVPPPAWDDSDSPIPVTSNDPMWGRRSALVTIVEYGDLQSSFCSDVERSLEQVRSTYGGDKVRIIWKNYPRPLDDNARPSAEAAMGVFALAGSDAFWAFERMALEGQGALNRENFEKWAKVAGVTDEAAYKEALDSHRWADKVEKDRAEGRPLGVKVTPTFFINGVSMVGPQPFELLRRVIDYELERAQAKLSAGTPKTRLYVEITKEAEKREAPVEPQDDGQDTKMVFKIPPGHSPVRGTPSALVTIIEFGEFGCRFCSAVEPTLALLRGKYGDQVRLVWKNARPPPPFHVAAEPAAQMAAAVRAEKGDEAFWKVHDDLFSKQRDLMSGSAPNIDAIVRIGSDAGVAAGTLKTAIKEHLYKRDIDTDASLAAAYGANGTPHFFINGRHLVGAQPQERFEKIIDEEIAKAQELVSGGTPPTDVYEALTRDGRGPSHPEEADASKSTPAPDYPRSALR
jgi:protein-disulfide isomerase